MPFITLGYTSIFHMSCILDIWSAFLLSGLLNKQKFLIFSTTSLEIITLFCFVVANWSTHYTMQLTKDFLNNRNTNSLVVHMV